MSLQIERVAVDGEESERLMAELCREVDQLYNNDLPTPWHLAGMDKPGAAFVMARRDGEGVGCAAIRPLTNEIAEMKRVFVRPRARRAGVALAMVHALEEIARYSGFTAMWIETGLRQPDAMRLYESLGYTQIAAFGDYKDDPLSVCYGKPLS